MLADWVCEDMFKHREHMAQRKNTVLLPIMLTRMYELAHGISPCHHAEASIRLNIRLSQKQGCPGASPWHKDSGMSARESRCRRWHLAQDIAARLPDKGTQTGRMLMLARDPSVGVSRKTG